MKLFKSRMYIYGFMLVGTSVNLHAMQDDKGKAPATPVATEQAADSSLQQLMQLFGDIAAQNAVVSDAQVDTLCRQAANVGQFVATTLEQTTDSATRLDLINIIRIAQCISERLDQARLSTNEERSQHIKVADDTTKGLVAIIELLAPRSLGKTELDRTINGCLSGVCTLARRGQLPAALAPYGDLVDSFLRAQAAGNESSQRLNLLRQSPREIMSNVMLERVVSGLSSNPEERVGADQTPEVDIATLKADVLSLIERLEKMVADIDTRAYINEARQYAHNVMATVPPLRKYQATLENILANAKHIAPTVQGKVVGACQEIAEVSSHVLDSAQECTPAIAAASSDERSNTLAAINGIRRCAGKPALQAEDSRYAAARIGLLVGHAYSAAKSAVRQALGRLSAMVNDEAAPDQQRPSITLTQDQLAHLTREQLEELARTHVIFLVDDTHQSGDHN